MRTVAQAVLDNITNSREITARATIRDRRLRFSQKTISDSAVTGALSHDVGVLSGVALRAAAVTTNPHTLKYQRITDLNGTWPAWSTYITHNLKDDSGIGVYEDRVFYHNDADNYIWYVDIGAGGPGAPVQVFNVGDVPIGIAPVSKTEFYVFYQTTRPPVTYNEGRIFHCNLTPTQTLWEGYVYGNNDYARGIDAVRVSGVDYIFILDVQEYRTLYMTKNGGVWSELKPVLPMDIIDTTSQFRMGGATLINSEIWVSGILKREYGKSMNVYTRGPEFTLGRDMFITLNGAETPGSYPKIGGKLIYVGNELWHIAPGFAYKAPGTTLTGYDDAAKKLVTSAIVDFDVGFDTNNPSDLNITLKSDTSHAAVLPGSEVELEIAYGGEYAKLGTYEIDIVHDEDAELGREYRLVCRSKAYRSMSQWHSDAAYDFWSQTKEAIDPRELKKVIRASGLWDQNGGTNSGMILEEMNDAGILYMASKASRNQSIRAKFIRHTEGSYANAIYGVGVCYHRESRYDASQRLGKDMEDVTDDDIGDNGFFVVYNNGNIEAYRVINGVWTQNYTEAHAIPVDQWHWLMATFHEGELAVYYRLDSSTTWTEWYRTKWLDTSRGPWTSDDLGRGAIYMVNNTVNSPIYSFSSVSYKIPVEDNSAFPVSDEVIVDSERISYNGKSQNISEGILNWSIGQLVAGQYTASPASDVDQPFGDLSSRQAVIQTFGEAGDIGHVKIRIKKTGTPGELYVGVHRDKSASFPDGVVVTSTTVPQEQINASAGWITVEFPEYVSLQSGWFLVLGNTSSYTVDASNYYTLKRTSSSTYAGGTLYEYDGDDSWIDTSTDGWIGMYGMPGGFSGSYPVMVDNGPNYTSAQLLNCALVVDGGFGDGLMFVIKDYDYRDPNPSVIYLDKSAKGLLSTDSDLYIVPTLYVVERGYFRTPKSAHTRGALASIYRDPTDFVEVDKAVYATSEEDLSFAESVEKIARLAGVDVVADALVTDKTFGASWAVDSDLENNGIIRRNFVCELECSSGDYGLAFRQNRLGASLYTGPAIYKSGTNLIYAFWDGATDTMTTRESFPLPVTISGKVKFSIWQDIVSVWVSGYFLHSFQITDGLSDDNIYAAVIGQSSASVTVTWYQADTRIDNFVVALGRPATSALSEILGQKRVFLIDDQNGDLRVFTDRTTVSALTDDIYVSKTDASQDFNIATRVRVEGAEVYEEIDETEIVERGNVFRQLNAFEVNDQREAIKYAEDFLGDAVLAANHRRVRGASDPRLEPQDVITVQGESIIIDSLTMGMRLSQEEAEFDMSCNGRKQ